MHPKCAVRDGRRVEAWDRSNNRLRPYSIEQAEALSAAGRVVAKRNRRGIITSIVFYGDVSAPLRLRRPQNVRFTEMEFVGENRSLRHKPLPYRAVDAATGYLESRKTIDLIVQSLFRGVTNSCFVSQTA